MVHTLISVYEANELAKVPFVMVVSYKYCLLKLLEHSGRSRISPCSCP